MSSRRGARANAQPFEVAADEYQSPFSLPPRAKAAAAPSDVPDENIALASPYFDEAESAEAIAWARSEEAVELEEDDSEEHGGIPIGGRRRRDSQVGSYDGGEGVLSTSIFDGPSAGAVPSSVSR